MTASVRFETAADSADSPARELICNVWPVLQGATGKELGEPIILGRSVSIADENSINTSKVDLPRAGDYLVEVELSNGQSTRRFISVLDHDAYRFVVHDRRYVSNAAKSPTPTSLAAVHSASLDIHNLIVGAVPPSPHDADLEVRVLETDVPIALDQLKSHLEQGLLAGTEGQILRRLPERSRFVTISLLSQAGSAIAGGTGRSWLRVSASGAFPTLIAYPRSWPLRGSKEPFRLAVRRAETSGPQASKWRVGLELLDPAYGALIESLNRRDTQSSRIISRTFDGEAYSGQSENSANPVAAAANAYLFALADSAPSPARGWLTRLQAAHPSIPDFSIALGWWQLRESERGDAGWTNAKLMLRASLQQGLPYYTLGLHILVDALNLLALAEPEDAGIKPWLSIVTALDTACVRKEPFTTLQVSRFFPSVSSTSTSED